MKIVYDWTTCDLFDEECKHISIKTPKKKKCINKMQNLLGQTTNPNMSNPSLNQNQQNKPARNNKCLPAHILALISRLNFSSSERKFEYSFFL